MTVVGAGAVGFLLQASVVAEILFRISGGVPRNFIPRGVPIQLRTERTCIWGTVGPLVKGSGGSCNLVQEISIDIVKFS